MSGIEFRDFTLWIREKNMARCLLDHINLEIPLGTVMMLIGASGSGKSTILKLLTGLQTPLTADLEMSGDCKVNGNTLMATQYPDELRHTAGLVFQDYALFDDFSPKENIMLAGERMGAEKYHYHSDLMRKVEEVSDRLNIKDIVTRDHIYGLSGGQKQRIALARLLIAQPQVMLFDEPTSGLDPLTAEDAARLIIGQAAADNIVIIVTHDYRPFLEYTDKISRIDILDGSGSLYNIQHIGRSPADITKDIKNRLINAKPSPKQPLSTGDYHQMRNSDFMCGFYSAFSKLSGLHNLLHPNMTQVQWHWKLWKNIFKFSIWNAMIFIFVSGLMLGMLATYFSLSENMGELQRFLDPILFSQAISAIGKIGFVVICPLFTAVFIATRSGSAVAGYLGNIVVTKQMDAYQVYGLPGQQLFMGKIVWSFAIGFFLLSALSFIGFWIASMTTVMVMRQTASYHDWSVAFYDMLGTFPYQGWGFFVLKSVTAGFFTGLASYFIGAAPKSSSQDVTKGITRCVMVNILLVLVIFFVILLYEKGM